jgi:hypothetical protein
MSSLSGAAAQDRFAARNRLPIVFSPGSDIPPSVRTIKAREDFLTAGLPNGCSTIKRACSRRPIARADQQVDALLARRNLSPAKRRC